MVPFDSPGLSPDAVPEVFTEDLTSPPVFAPSMPQGGTAWELVADMARSAAAVVAARNARVLR